MQSRFMKGDKNPTILIIASSKRTQQSFMETFIHKRKEMESKTTLVVDEPQWVIRNDKDSNIKFKIAVGNKFLQSEVIPLNATPQDLQEYRNRGFNLLDVPIGYYEQFVEDIDKSLQDIAGISTTSSSRYISGVRLKEVKNPQLKNPFERDIIEVGNAENDTAQYYNFFNMENVPQNMKEKPLYVHLDMSISGDKTGIAGIWIKGSKPHVEGEPESRDGLFQLAFSVSVKAPKGYQVSFEKNRQFIYWLKEQGFNLKGVSADTFQSYDLLQALQARNIPTEIISVDRLTDRVCLLGDSLVQTENGNYRIDEIVPGDKVISYNIEQGVSELDDVVYWEHTKDVMDYLTIETDDGVINCTPDHLILTSRGYVQAQDLTESDLILKI